MTVRNPKESLLKVISAFGKLGSVALTDEELAKLQAAQEEALARAAKTFTPVVPARQYPK